MVPSDALKSYYHYPGSLTTPGCYETVTWNVMKTPLYVTDAQVCHYADFFLFAKFIYSFITKFKVGLHQLALTLIKSNYNNENNNKNEVSFLVALLLTVL